mgnify:CR=1 FL=1
MPQQSFMIELRFYKNQMTLRHSMRRNQPAIANVFSSLFKQLLTTLTLVVFCSSIISCGKSTEKSPTPVASEPPPMVESPLAKAAVRGAINEIKALIDDGAEINAKDALGRTPLHIAAFYGRTKTSEYLISRGADIDAKDRVGMTPLHVAVISGGRQEVELLLEKKADISSKTDAGQTALHLSASTGQPKLTKFLIERGANPKTKDNEGKTPLFYAIQNKHPQTASVLQPYTPKE